MIQVPTTPPWFAFLVHPRTLADVRGAAGGLLPEDCSRAHARQVLSELSPRIIALARSNGSLAQGEVIAVPRLPEDLFTPGGRRAIEDALALAIARGARVIGLGGLISPATGAGTRLIRNLPPHVVVTNGNALTAGVLYHNVRRLLAERPVTSRAVAVIGATGSVGVPLSGLLHETGLRLILVGRHEERVRELLSGSCPGAKYSGSVEDAYDAGVIVLLVSDLGADLDPSRTRPETVLLDPAQPAAISPRERAIFAAANVRVIEGGIVRFPGVLSGFDFGLADRSCAYACFAETYLRARAGIPGHSVGRPTAEKASLLLHEAERLGIEPIGMSVTA